MWGQNESWHSHTDQKWSEAGCQKCDLLSKHGISDEQYTSFLQDLDNGYGFFDNPYHNASHGADVMHNVYHLLLVSDVAKHCPLSDGDVLCALIAGAIHDYKHPGRNNNFLNNWNNVVVPHLKNYDDAKMIPILRWKADANTYKLSLDKDNFHYNKGSTGLDLCAV